MIKNFFHLFKKNFILNILLIIMTGIYLNLSFILLNFGLAPRAPMMSFSSSPIEGMEIFTLWVEEINNNRNNLTLSNMQEFYYDVLHGSPYFYSFAMGLGQPLIVGDAELTVEKFDWNAFELFGSEFEIQSGRNFVRDDFNYFKGYFPIVLGNAFSEHNAVGDKFSAEYFFSQWDFKVIGILEPNQSFSRDKGPYNYHFLLPVDHYVFIPFISNRNHLNQVEYDFWFTMYELLIQSNILVESNPTTIDYMMNRIHTGLQHTGMVIRVDTMTGGVFSSIEIQNLIRFQQNLMLIFFGSLTLIYLLILSVLCRIKIKSVEKNLKSLMIMGCKRWKIFTVYIMEGLSLFIPLFIFIHEYWMWDSGFLMQNNFLRMWNRNPLTSRMWWNHPQRDAIWWNYSMFWEHSQALRYASLVLLVIFIYSVLIPIVSIIKLYRGRRIS